MLAAHILRRNALTVIATSLLIGVGVAATTSSAAAVRALTMTSQEVRPNLVLPWFDSRPSGVAQVEGAAPMLMAYRDAIAISGSNQSQVVHILVVRGAVAAVGERLDQGATIRKAVYATSSFFSVFEPPFQFGSPWNQNEDDTKANVVVLSKRLNDYLYDGANSVGRMIELQGHQFRVVGVLAEWRPAPRIYAVPLKGSAYGPAEDVLVPFATARDQGLPLDGQVSCYDGESPSSVLENTDCIWISLWGSLQSSSDSSAYQAFVDSYISSQKAIGRLPAAVDPELLTLGRVLDVAGIIPRELYLQAAVSSGFLVVCLVNAAGLLLSAFMRESYYIGLHRALGASRTRVIGQYLMVGLFAGVVGSFFSIALTYAGIGWLQSRPFEYSDLIGIDLATMVLSLAAAVVSGSAAAIAPALRCAAGTPYAAMKRG